MSKRHKFDLKVCRACLSPADIRKLTSMFAGDGSIGQKFREFSSVDVSSEFSFQLIDFVPYFGSSDILGSSRRRPDL